MIEIIAKKDQQGKVYFEATESGSILEWSYSLETLLQRLSLMADQFKDDLINNI
ncbi:hypothetical protein OOZ35_14185 [Mesoflavibacter profundi]|jgi:hypothetical protein|uniref:PH domain-containing protein n=1 Tax=Mesoflavibacter profundi TaxID=2708110 RepID=A0ABT4RVP5_9FLAO|nr:hypothetical protein [Mesoflavibacter profundi]MDA0175897.1 hypothetical protein [Mesoflavibacter profundi]MDA0178648.1 hypothetical protein [Mesoflavibacter profundi]